MGVVVDGWRGAAGVRGMRYMIFKQISNLHAQQQRRNTQVRNEILSS